MQSKFWCYTINNEDENKVNSEEIIANAWQIEQGESGTTHIQGYLQLRSRRRLSFLKGLHQTAHWEARRGTHSQALDYVTKEETRLRGPYFQGEFDVRQGRRNDLEALQSRIREGAGVLEISEEFFGSFLRYGRGILSYIGLRETGRDWEMDVRVYWGSAGAGKTRAVYDYAREQSQSVYPLSQNYNGGVVWWDGYDGQRIVLIDDFYGWLPFSYLLRLLDRYPMLLRCRDGHVHFKSTVIFITSNSRPDEWYPNVEGERKRALFRRFTEIKEFGF